MQGQYIEALESLQVEWEYCQKSYWTAIVAMLGMATCLLTMLANSQRIGYMQNQGKLDLETSEELMGKILKDYCYLS
jgi:hypothetical protein